MDGGIYHVYNRFARGAKVFREGDEAERFLGLLRKVRDRDGLTFFAWTLMSNHYHLALRTGAVPLSRTMGYVQARFGQSYNHRRKSSGPRWQSRYKARLVEDSRYLIGALAIERWGVQAKELGGLLGRRPEVVTRWAARGAESRLDSELFQVDYERLDRMMAKSGTLKLGKRSEDAIVGGPGT